MHSEPILVVGAGPTGLLLAAELARHGAPVRIVDRREGGCRESRALGVQAGALAMLDRVGLAEEFIARGQRVRGFSMWDGRRRLVRVDYGVLDCAHPFLLDIPQDETEAILRDHLARLGVAVEGSTEVTGLTVCPDAVEVTARRPDGVREAIRASYVVGCDGAHSTVRRELAVPFDGAAYAGDWLLADVAIDWDRSPDDVHIFLNAEGRAAVLMPMRGGRWRAILYFAGEGGAEAGPPALEEVAGLLARRVPGPLSVSDPSWLARFRTHRRSAPMHRRGRVLLAGDAVHIHSPAGGQGMNTGLLDAHNLGWKLAAVAAGRAPDRLLDSYEAERAPVARQVLGLTHGLVRLSSMTAPWQRAARAAALPLAARMPGVRSRAALRMSQLSVHYRSGPLTADAGRGVGGGPLAGDRAPDAAGLVHRGRPARLHELLRDPRHTCLLMGGAGSCPRPDVAGVRWLVLASPGDTSSDGPDVAVDARGEARRRYGTGRAYLVRPDGYVAARGREAIEAYLRRISA
jgi:2-polyprenyl-6-methoxyphenol hydroxylase-like FAD-dependent oxidoreductase